MAKTRVGINGFGRIGRNFFRAALERDADFEIVAANDLGDAETMAHLLKFDSTARAVRRRGRASRTACCSAGGQRDQAAGRARPGERCRGASSASTSCSSRPASSPSREGAQKHLDAGAKKVVISAPGDRPRHHARARRQRRQLRPRAAPHHLERVVHDQLPRRRWRRCCNDAFGIERGFMTTIHAYTADQRLQDMPHSDLRRARAAAINLIPTSTGAAKAIGLVLPELAGKLDGVAVRAPVPTGSITDLVAIVRERGDRRRGQRRLRGGGHRAARSKGYLQYSTDAARLHRHQAVAVLVHLRQQADDGEREPASRCSAGTTTSGATRAGWSTS